MAPRTTCRPSASRPAAAAAATFPERRGIGCLLSRLAALRSPFYREKINFYLLVNGSPPVPSIRSPAASRRSCASSSTLCSASTSPRRGAGCVTRRRRCWVTYRLVVGGSTVGSWKSVTHFGWYGMKLLFALRAGARLGGGRRGPGSAELAFGAQVTQLNERSFELSHRQQRRDLRRLARSSSASRVCHDARVESTWRRSRQLAASQAKGLPRINVAAVDVWSTWLTNASV